MAKSQALCSGVQAYRTSLTNLQIAQAKIEFHGPELMCDISTGRPRPIVPPDFKRPVFEAINNLAHTGVKATGKLITEKFVWHGIRKDIFQWVKECHDCQSSKIYRHTRTPPELFPVPEKTFSHINIDIIGPLPQSSECTHLLTIIH